EDQTVRADSGVPVAQLASQGIRRPVGGLGRRHIEKVVPVGVRFRELHFRQKASRCQPNRRTKGRGSALKVPTNSPWHAAPFHPPCRRDLPGNRSGTMAPCVNPLTRRRNSPMLNLSSTGASSCSSPTFISFERPLSHETRL